MKPLSHPDLNEVESTHLFYALGDESRLHIVKNLYRSKEPLTCIQAVQGIDNLPISTRSNCFRVLRESGLIRSEKQGRECYNSLRLDELNTKFPSLMEAIINNS
jgi:DNA-binding transcriptional ArsR family regulator